MIRIKINYKEDCLFQNSNKFGENMPNLREWIDELWVCVARERGVFAGLAARKVDAHHLQHSSNFALNL
jgi:hypothetical protein